MNIPREIAENPEATHRFEEVMKVAEKGKLGETVASFHALMETCLQDGMPEHIQKAVFKAAIGEMNTRYAEFGDKVADGFLHEISAHDEPAPAALDCPSGSEPARLLPDGTLQNATGGNISLRTFFEELKRTTFVQSFYATEDRPEPSPQSIAKSYAWLRDQMQEGRVVRGNVFVTQEQVLALMDAVLDKWKPGLSRMVRSMAAPIAPVQKPLASAKETPEQKLAQKTPVASAPTPATKHPEQSAGLPRVNLTPGVHTLYDQRGNHVSLAEVLKLVDREPFGRLLMAVTGAVPPPAVLAAQYREVLDLAREGLAVRGMYMTQGQLAVVLDAHLEARQKGLATIVKALAEGTPTTAPKPAPVAAPKPAPVPVKVQPAPPSNESKEVFPPKSVILKGSREGKDPWMDNGALHMIEAIKTGLGEVAMTTGVGYPKEAGNTEALINRDAVGMKWDGESVTIVAADGVGWEADSNLAAIVATEAAIGAPSFNAVDAEAVIREALQEADLDKKASTCLSAVRITRKPDGTYYVEDIQSGDTTFFILDGESEFVSEEQNLARSQRDMEKKLREMGALTDTQNIGDLPMSFDVQSLDDAEREELASIRRLIKKYGYESYLARAPHRLTGSLKARGGYMENNRTKDIHSGALVMVGTDGVFDNINVYDAIDAIRAAERERGEPLHIEEVIQLLTEAAFALMQSDPDGKGPKGKNGKPDNIGLAGIRLH